MTVTPTEGHPVEVVDERGMVIEVVPRREVRARNLRHRTVFVVVVNRAGELLVHRRADWKDVWPGRWDLAVGGVCQPGEAWEVAAARELDEELGVQAELVYLGEDVYDDADVRELARAYLIRHEGPFSLPDGEVTEVAWVAPLELPAWLSTHDLCPDSRAVVLPRLDAP
jgi:isopentenyldiphosphate isomerase